MERRSGSGGSDPAHGHGQLWAGATPELPALGRPSPSDALHGPGGLADQLLAAQLQALQLGPAPPAAAALYGVAAPTATSAGVMGGAALQAPGHATAPGMDHGQQLDAALLASQGLLGQLGLGAGLPGGALPPAAPAFLQAPLLHQQAFQQQLAEQDAQQQQQRAAGGRRRGGGGGRRNEDKVRRTVYISDIADTVTEAQLAAFFQDCGQLVDCRVCGDPNSSMRFAFIEFHHEASAQQALLKSGALLGDFAIRVSPSKTAIVPVNNTYLPRSSEERELVARTVFVGNVDRVVEREQLREFFENLCGPVSKIRLLGDTQHNAKIAFIEFVTADSARGALKLSGALLGALPLRVSPSKTPVRIESRRAQEARGSPLNPGGAPALPTSHPAHHPALLMAVAGLQLYAPGNFNRQG